MWMAQARSGACLFDDAQSIEVRPIGLAAHHLDRDLPLQLLVVGAIDDAHAARPEAREDAKVSDDLPDHGVRWTSAALTSQRRSPSAASVASRDGSIIVSFSKYVPVTVLNSGRVASATM